MELQAQLHLAQLKIQELQIENENLRKNQEAFQNAIIDEVKRIESTPKAWRWMQYGKLLFQLIDTIREAVNKSKKV
jgi:predicted oxidoreductase